MGTGWQILNWSEPSSENCCETQASSAQVLALEDEEEGYLKGEQGWLQASVLSGKANPLGDQVRLCSAASSELAPAALRSPLKQRGFTPGICKAGPNPAPEILHIRSYTVRLWKKTFSLMSTHGSWRYSYENYYTQVGWIKTISSLDFSPHIPFFLAVFLWSQALLHMLSTLLSHLRLYTLLAFTSSLLSVIIQSIVGNY